MQQIRNFEDVNKVLAKYILAVKEITGKDITLVRMRPLMEQLGNPENKLKIIHIAGTSGKTSTSYYISALLKQAGCKVGLTVSPHIECINERVQIDLEPLNEKQFCEALEQFLELIKNVDPEPTYFELLIAFVYWYFVKAGVDYAVIETGLGGLHDATNVASRADKICVITDIGYDHMHVLGNTLPLIATQKAGIFYPGNTAFMFNQSPEINEVFVAQAKQRGTTLNMLSVVDAQSSVQGTNMLEMPTFQQRNWTLAYSVFNFLSTRDNLAKLPVHKLQETTKTHVPGRMDIITKNGKTIILDGAHNQQKMIALVASFKAKYPGKKAVVLLSLKQDKDFKSVLPLLLPFCSQLIITSFETTQDFLVRSMDINLLSFAAKEAGFKNVIVEPNNELAYQQLLNNSEPICLVTGSFYLLSNLLKFIK